jgi:hypothetical protein
MTQFFLHPCYTFATKIPGKKSILGELRNDIAQDGIVCLNDESTALTIGERPCR